MPKYIYEGNRDSANTSSSMFYFDQGTVVELGEPPRIFIGEEIDLSVSERDRLSPYFIFSDKKHDDVGEGLTAPTTEPPNAGQPDVQTTDPDNTIQEKSSPSASSKKG